jgi:hypothetical protein
VKKASRLAAISGALVTLGLGAQVLESCAVGTMTPEGESGSTSDASPPSAIDGSSAVDGASNTDANGPDRGNARDSSALSDASDDADANESAEGADSSSDAATDAGSTVIFGATCPTGTTYTEPFTSNPVADGTFLPLIGSSTVDATNHTLTLQPGNPNAQLWIGARPSWTSYTVSAQVRIDTSGGNGGFTFRMESTPASPANNAGQMYFAGIATNQVLLGLENGNWTEFAGPSATFAVGTFYTLAVTANGSALSVSVNGTAYVTSYSDTTYSYGSFGLRAYASGMTFGAITVTCN